MPISAPLADFPHFNAKERTKIQTIINQRDHLLSIDPDSEHVKRRIEAYTWAIGLLEDEQGDPDDPKFFVLQARRNQLDEMPSSEMNGFLDSERRAVDWLMEELVPGSGRYANRKKLKPWLVENLVADYGYFAEGVVLAETAEDAIDVVLTTEKIRYGDNELETIDLGDQLEMKATQLTFRRGLLSHRNNIL